MPEELRDHSSKEASFDRREDVERIGCPVAGRGLSAQDSQLRVGLTRTCVGRISKDRSEPIDQQACAASDKPARASCPWALFSPIHPRPATTSGAPQPLPIC